MKIDLCKIFNVEEDEEFKIDRGVNYPRNNTYFIKDNTLLYKNEQCGVVIEESNLGVNTLKQIKEIIKLPKKKSFSQDTLNFFKYIDRRWEWIARDKDGKVFVYDRKPTKTKSDNWDCTMYCRKLDALNQSLFDQILWEDEEPIFIDDYVIRD